MKNKNLLGSLLLIIIIIALWLWKQNGSQRSSSDDATFRNTTHLILTKHARCRMDCRHITEGEIKEIIHNGKVNEAKSGPGTKGDETYALEGYSNEQQHLRIVVAPEDDGLVVITCIDLDNEWQCNCD